MMVLYRVSFELFQKSIQVNSQCHNYSNFIWPYAKCGKERNIRKNYKT